MFNTLLVALDGGPQHARVLDLAAAIAGSVVIARTPPLRPPRVR